jgi:hypothetical protein
VGVVVGCVLFVVGVGGVDFVVSFFYLIFLFMRLCFLRLVVMC